MEIIIILISLVLSAFFSGMEIAFISANRLKIELDKKQGIFSSGIVSIFIKNPKKYISTMLIGNNVALVVYSMIMAKVLEPRIEYYISSDAGILISQTIISTIIILIFAEFLPKMVFRLNPNSFLNTLSIPVLIFYITLYPLNKFVVWFSNFIMKYFFKVKSVSKSRTSPFSKVDLDHLLNNSQADKNDEDEIEHDIKIFQNALDFSTLKLRNCIIPRTEIEAINIDDSIENLKQKFISTGYSKLLVFRDSIDNIVGYVHNSEIFKNPKQIKNIVKDTLIVPESMPANKLLKLFISQNKNIAVVVDEFGGTSGIVTIEDIIEEIFGEIQDEHDSDEFIDKKLSEREYIFSGRLEIDYINEKYNINLPVNDEYSTIAGFILYHYGSFPNINDNIEYKDFNFKILKSQATRIELIKLSIKI